MRTSLVSKSFSVVSLCLAISAYSFSQAQTGESGYKKVSALGNYANSLCKEVVENGKTTDKPTENDLA